VESESGQLAHLLGLQQRAVTLRGGVSPTTISGAETSPTGQGIVFMKKSSRFLFRRWLIATAGMTILTACPTSNENAVDDPQSEGVEDLTIVVEADKSRILEQEQNLEVRAATIEEEQQRLAIARESITKQIDSLSKKDKKQRDKLESEEQRLADEEKKLRNRRRDFESERVQLEKQKTDLLEKITSLTGSNAGGISIEQRESRIAQREKDIARREAKLTEQQKNIAKLHDDAEKSLKEINTILAGLQAGGGMTRTVVVNNPVPSGTPSNKGQVQRLQRQIKAEMDAKGILEADLPPAARDHQSNAKRSLNAKEFSAAEEALKQLQAVVAGINIDHSFVKAKFLRINNSYQANMKNLDEKKKSTVLGLLDDVSDSFSDGRFDRANRKINQINSLLTQ